MEKEIELIEIEAHSIEELNQKIEEISNIKYNKITIHVAVILSKNLSTV